MSLPSEPRAAPRGREPIVNLPGVVTWSALALGAIHLARQFIGADQDFRLLAALSFIPARFTDAFIAAELPGGLPARWWSPLSYALLHGDWQHLAMNTLWLVVFGSAVAWRFGPFRFLIFSALGCAAGAGAHLLAHQGEIVPMVGASAGISALTAAAARFVFEAGGPFDGFRHGPSAFRRPAPPFLASLRNPRVFFFVAIWVVMALFAAVASVPGVQGVIAWEAHLGGFAAGLILFPLFDPIPRAPRYDIP